jgi:hypothetical protein
MVSSLWTSWLVFPTANEKHRLLRSSISHDGAMVGAVFHAPSFPFAASHMLPPPLPTRVPSGEGATPKGSYRDAYNEAVNIVASTTASLSSLVEAAASGGKHSFVVRNCLVHPTCEAALSTFHSHPHRYIRGPTTRWTSEEAPAPVHILRAQAGAANTTFSFAFSTLVGF